MFSLNSRNSNIKKYKMKSLALYDHLIWFRPTDTFVTIRISINPEPSGDPVPGVQVPVGTQMQVWPAGVATTGVTIFVEIAFIVVGGTDAGRVGNPGRVVAAACRPTIIFHC